jgi:hypothetical protein
MIAPFDEASKAPRSTMPGLRWPGSRVEVTNTSRRSIDLDGWTLLDRDGNRYRFEDLRLRGHATVCVSHGPGP